MLEDMRSMKCILFFEKAILLKRKRKIIILFIYSKE